jgi:hypothetical protein
MSVQIADLNMSNQNVMPAQIYSPVEPQELPTDNKKEIESELPTDQSRSSSSPCGCVDTYA